jgi:ABC-type multidrug transport system ATPase subunit
MEHGQGIGTNALGNAVSHSQTPERALRRLPQPSRAASLRCCSMNGALLPRCAVNLRVDKVSRSFGAARPLREVSFSLSPGTIVALTGENGSGKSTLLRILAGSFRPDGGSVEIGTGAPGKGMTGYLPPGERGLYWRLSGRQNLEFFASVGAASAGGVQASAGQAAEAVGAQELLPKRAGDCSTGQRRRLMFASGLLARPPVLLWDEPFADLDERGRDTIRGLARRWATSGGIVFYASPTVEEGPTPDVELALAGGSVRAAINGDAEITMR